VKVLLLNQCFWPDIVATAQQLTGVARGLLERGHEVTVISSRRGYDNAELRFPKHEIWNGIEIIRLPSISLGKTSRWRRALNFASFSAAAALRLMLTPPQDTVIALTSPPLISWLASVFTRMKGGRMVFWVMDLNPDAAIAAGWLKHNSVTAKLLAALLQISMRRAEKIIVLDRFMKDRIAAKGIPEQKIDVLPPSRDDSVTFDEKGREAFRRRHELTEKFVVMYAGNHSPCNPLDTLLGAANKLKARDDIAFVFVGGGSELAKVKAFARTNQLKTVRCLPYQSLSELPAVLSAADLHAVTLGQSFRGIIHPSKIYNILAIGSPFVYIGPGESHVAEIISNLPDRQQASSAQHGQVDVVVNCIRDRAELFRSNQGRVARFADSSVATTPQFINQIESIRPEANYLAQTSKSFLPLALGERRGEGLSASSFAPSPKPLPKGGETNHARLTNSEPQTKVCATNEQ
jgi:glycosyltransferase involved in cell wall biosynthesis